VPLNHDAVEELLRDPVIIRIVTVVNLASLSVLELLEYNLSREDINRAMAKGVIAFDKSTLPKGAASVEKSSISGDYYFKFLSSKVRLTELGQYILETIEGNEQPSLSSSHPPSEEEEMPASPRGPIF